LCSTLQTQFSPTPQAVSTIPSTMGVLAESETTVTLTSQAITLTPDTVGVPTEIATQETIPYANLWTPIRGAKTEPEAVQHLPEEILMFL